MKIEPQLLEFAKSMRHSAKDAENLMWQILRAKRFMNLKFRRQHVIQPYIVDFYCHEIGFDEHQTQNSIQQVFFCFDRSKC